MVVFDQDLPLLAGQDPAAGPDLAISAQAAFELRPAVDIGAGIGRVGQHVVDGVVGRLDPPDLGAVQIRRRGQRPFQACARSHSHTARADPHAANCSNTATMTPLTASSGWNRTSVGPSPQTSPTGRAR